MEKKIFEILEKMKLEVITIDEAQKQLCVLFGVIQRSEQLINCDCKHPDIGNGEWDNDKKAYICINCNKAIN